MKKKQKIVIGTIGLSVVLLFILWQGTQSILGAGSISRLLARVIRKSIEILTGNTESNIHDIELLIRKFAHFIEYFVLATIMYQLLLASPLKRYWVVPVCLLLMVPFPLIDEYIIQANTAGRGAYMLDVIVDYLGIFVAICTGMLYSWIYRHGHIDD